MRTLKINARIGLTVALLGVLLILTGALGALGMTASDGALRDAYEVHYASVVALGKSGNAMSRARFGLDWAMSNPRSPQLPAQLDRARSLLADSERWWESFRALPKTEELQRLTADLGAKRESVLHDGIDKLLVAIRSGDAGWMDESRANYLIGLYTAMNQSQSALERYLDDAAQNASNRSASLCRRLLVASLSSIFIGLGMAAWSWWSLRRSIMTPLHDALRQFDVIAAGELTARVPIRADDEMGALMRGLEAMQARLRATVASVRSGSHSIATSTQQIAAGNLDLSHRTEDQAASLEETASAMEQLTSTVQLNSDSAEHARQLAQDASSMASRGRDAVSNMVETMRAMHADSARMTDIIATIEGIAFQTNILALNAAVEAARAGEEGRGFAVVASEVRSLAQRSAVAAKQIGVLIADATLRVERGAGVADNASSTIHDIESAIAKVARIVSEIATASREQSDSIRQVSLAVTRMDEVTQQNAALVEESAATATSLADQAQQLKELTAAFSVAEADDKALAG